MKQKFRDTIAVRLDSDTQQRIRDYIAWRKSLPVLPGMEYLAFEDDKTTDSMFLRQLIRHGLTVVERAMKAKPTEVHDSPDKPPAGI